MRYVYYFLLFIYLSLISTMLYYDRRVAFVIKAENLVLCDVKEN